MAYTRIDSKGITTVNTSKSASKSTSSNKSASSKTYEIPNSSGGYTTVTAGSKSEALSKAASSGASIKLDKGLSSDYLSQDKPAVTREVPEQPVAPNEPITTDTSQPSPQVAKSLVANQAPVATPTTSQAQNVAKTPASKYEQAYQSATASGIPSPVDGGVARSQGTQFMPAEIQDFSAVNTALGEDPMYTSIMKQWSEYFSPKKQTESLVSEYQKLVKKSGIDEINSELIDTQRIIDGTEDDIRSEVAAASGFATDSQVLAMANARNKSLIKNYNTLLATRDSIQKNLDTMINLSQQDRQMAQQRSEQQLNLGFQILNYRDKMQSNAREAYNNVVSTLGYQGLYNSLKNSPYELSLAEKTLGLGSGQLAKLATQRDLDREYKIAQINSANRANRSSGNEYGTLSGKPQNATQSAANSYANRLNESDVIIGSIGSKFTGKLSQLPTLNFLKSSERQSYEQAQKNFVTAVLRRESGASISPSEFKTAKEVYFPMPGDTPEVVAQKAITRNTVINNFYREADVNRPVLPGQIIESNAKRYKVGADGNTLEEI